MLYRLSFVFQAGPVGWSEQWYANEGFDAKTMADVVLTVPFKTAFMSLRADGVYLRALRINDIQNPRNSYLAVCNVGASNYNGTGVNTGEHPNVAVMGLVTTGAGRKRSVMIRGLIDAQVNRDDNDQMTWDGNLWNLLAEYRREIIQQEFCVRTLDPADNINNPDRQLVQLGPAPGDQGSTLLTYAGPALTPGKPVVIHGISRKTLPGYTGPLPSFGDVAGSVQVPVIWRSPGLVIPGRGATIRTATYTIDPVADIEWTDMRTKRCGRPTLAPRGRRTGVVYRSR